MINTKSEGTGGDSFFEDSASILLTALVSYVCLVAEPEERNLNLVLDMMNAIELRDDPEWKNAVDTLMENLEKRYQKQKKPVTAVTNENGKLRKDLEKYKGQGITDTMKYYQARTRAPQRMADTIADIIRQPPERAALEHEQPIQQRSRSHIR